MESLKELISLVESSTKEEKEKITEAYNFAQKAHDKQLRYSGKPYFVHSYETGKNLALIDMSPTMIIAGLLHDVIEDTDVEEEEIREKFGEEILFLINGVTKLGKIRFKGLTRHV
jgi:(p)ppGpp synthase/HD superfamily hydrolase